MKKIFEALRIPAIVLLFVTSFIACDKDFYVLDSSVLGKDNANFDTDNTETLPIVAYNKKLGNVQINNLPSNLLGFFDDPAYGASTASIVTQITPTSFNPDFGTDPVIDSVVLTIPYFSRATGIDENGVETYTISDSLYGRIDDNGNAAAPVKLSIYENNYFLRSFNPNNLDESQNYYSHANDPSTDNFSQIENSLINFDDHKGSLLYTVSDFKPNTNAIVLTTGEGEDVSTSRITPALRLKLDTPFWTTKILDKEGATELSNNNNFQNYFRGLYIKAEAINNDGNMILLNTASTDAQIVIHYSRGESENRTQSTYNFNLNGNRLNTFINNFDITIPDGDETNGDGTLYLKGGEGSMAVVDLFPTNEDLNNFIDEYRISIGNGEWLTDNSTGDFILKKLINEAHIEVFEDNIVNNGVDDDFHQYDRIYAYDIKNNIPTIDYTIDFTENVANPVSSRVVHLGIRQESTTSGKEGFNYKIRLTEHLNNILRRDSTNTKIGLVLSTNVNLTNNANILNSSDDVTIVPAASIISPRGTILHGTNTNDNRKMRLKIFSTEPK